jgi:hypothetical protein
VYRYILLKPILPTLPFQEARKRKKRTRRIRKRMTRRRRKMTRRRRKRFEMVWQVSENCFEE